MKKLIFIITLFISLNTYATTYYIAPSTATPAGNDINAGTILTPWLTWTHALTIISAGDTVYFRDGIYIMTEWPTINKSGTPTNPICFFNYPNEKPIFDFSALGSKYVGVNCGVEIWGRNYLSFRGLTIVNLKQVINNYEAYGYYMNGCNWIKFDQCIVHEIGGMGFFTTNSDSTMYYNCDAYDCADSLDLVDPGNFATGFDWGIELGKKILFHGCRAWHCADDGFSGRGEGYVELDSCWSWNHGYLSHGGGSGFKPGPCGIVGACSMDGNLQHKIRNCISAYNNTGSAAIGFNENTDGYGKPKAEMYNNIAYKNGLGFYGGTAIYNLTNDNVYKNNISYGSTLGYGEVVFQISYTHSNNSWDSPVTITNADFISVDSTGISGARQVDGSLPVLNFLKLTLTSDAIDAGVYVGLPFYGINPDVGYDEYYFPPLYSDKVFLKKGSKFLKSNGKLLIINN